MSSAVFPLRHIDGCPVYSECETSVNIGSRRCSYHAQGVHSISPPSAANGRSQVATTGGASPVNETITARAARTSLEQRANAKRTKLSPAAAYGPNGARGARSPVACIPALFIAHALDAVQRAHL